MSGSVAGNRSFNPLRSLAVLAALMVFMYLCSCTLRFTNDGLNLAFGAVFYLLPLLAVRPARRLPRLAKITSLILLAPVLVLSFFGLSSMAACDIPDAINHAQLSRELCTIYQEQYSVRLSWDETSGGAIGPHGVSLQQRRNIFPGLYAVKFLDWFEGASEGTLSFEGPNRVSLYIPAAGYALYKKEVRRVYSLKPWLYF
ncbi:MAG TPA: hypothetical protein VGL22_08490 [Terracidiphilus sp.]|jgi:hypothetical protein